MMFPYRQEIQNIKSLDPAWLTQARKRLAEQTRPQGSLGFLESILERLAAIQKKDRLSLSKKQILIFAADHGVSHEGVSLYPREVTAAMVRNFLNGGATINAIARNLQAEVRVIDMGVDADLGSDPRLIPAKLGPGTRNMVHEPAMTEAELETALTTGWQQVEKAREEGVELLGLGEMGIGNTTSASAVIAALLELSPEKVTGRGTGLGDEALQHKIKVIEAALQKHKRSMNGPLSVLQHVGGFEIAAMTGAILAAAYQEMPLVVDGWIVSAAALAAAELNPKTLDYLFFAHQSEEAGHRLLLEKLEVQPILNLSMRLGEASGAALAMGILDSAARIYNEVATFEEAGVANREG